MRVNSRPIASAMTRAVTVFPSRDVFEEDVTAGEDGGEHGEQHPAIDDGSLLDALEDRPNGRRGLVGVTFVSFIPDHYAEPS